MELVRHILHLQLMSRVHKIEEMHLKMQRKSDDAYNSQVSNSVLDVSYLDIYRGYGPKSIVD